MDKLKVLFSMFLVIILGVIFAQILADETYDNTNYASISQGFTYTKGTNATLTYVPVSFTSVTNASGSVVTASNYTTAYTASKLLGILDNSSACQNGQTCYANYRYQQDAYVVDGTSRTLLGLIVLFFVFGILGLVVWYTYQNGLLDFK